jgi:hypothetical protein
MPHWWDDFWRAWRHGCDAMPSVFLLGGFRSPSVLTIPWLWLRPRRACLCFVKRIVLGWASFFVREVWLFFGCL